ncbi:MAG: archaellin/type IV pilin N-terminal domain-containing protein [Halobacterium sp.]
MSDRGQSNVVGVAILLGVTVVALGALTASVGTVVDHHAAASDARRVAADLDDAIQPVETTGVHRGRLAFARGSLDLVPRQVRVLDSGGVVAEVDANALRFSTGSRGATYLAGAVLVHGDGWSRTRSALPVAADPRVLVVSVPALRGDVHRAASGGASYTLRTNVTHHRRVLGDAGYRVAVETTHVAAVRRQLAASNATVSTRDVDGDGVPSVVADYPGVRTAYLVVHETEVSVT